MTSTITGWAPRPDEPEAADTAPARPRWARPAQQPVWVRPSLAGLAAATMVLYCWDLSRNGMANGYYAAAVKSGTESWKAFFFGSLDPGSFITVDKPPAAFWVQALSARLFGFSSWSILVPEALAGVASVLILHRLVSQWAGHAAGLAAGGALALTPVAVVMFRFNNPDALLTLLLLAAAWATWAAVETGRTRHLISAGVLLGLAFDTKMLQALIVLPALAGVYLWAGPPKLGRRLAQLLAGGAALAVSGGWWVAAVAAWPAASRPYIGSTTDNSIISLIFGYNGLSRLFGSGGPGGRGGGPTFGGAPGWLRLFNTELGGQIAWLLPMAALGLVAGIWTTRRGVRTDRARAGYVLWGGWAVVTFAVFSNAKGTFHPYYTVALAPGVAALAAGGAASLWRAGRANRAWAWVLPVGIAATAAVAVDLLRRTPGYDTWLVPAIIALAALAAAGMLAGGWQRARWLPAAAATAGLLAVLAGPAAYAVTTVRTTASGPTPSAGPAGAGFVGPGGLRIAGRAPFAGFPGGGELPGAGGFPGGGFPGGGLPGGGPAAAGGFPGGTLPTGGFPGGFGPRGGDGAAVDRTLITYLQAHRGGAEYLVAVQGAASAEPIILATGQPVIAMGGFTGSDPTPTAAQLEALVKAGKLRYILLGSGGGPGGGGGSDVSSWVTSHGKAVNYGATSASGTLYLVSP